MPFSLARADQFRPIPPPAPGTVEWTRQIDVLIKTSGALTDKEKAEAEYWGIRGMAPAPQLIEMTKFISNANDLRLDDDVKLFFVASNAILTPRLQPGTPNISTTMCAPLPRFAHSAARS